MAVMDKPEHWSDAGRGAVRPMCRGPSSPLKGAGRNHLWAKKAILSDRKQCPVAEKRNSAGFLRSLNGFGERAGKSCNTDACSWPPLFLPGDICVCKIRNGFVFPKAIDFGSSPGAKSGGIKACLAVPEGSVLGGTVARTQRSGIYASCLGKNPDMDGGTCSAGCGTARGSPPSGVWQVL